MPPATIERVHLRGRDLTVGRAIRRSVDFTLISPKQELREKSTRSISPKQTRRTRRARRRVGPKQIEAAERVLRSRPPVSPAAAISPCRSWTPTDYGMNRNLGRRLVRRAIRRLQEVRKSSGSIRNRTIPLLDSAWERQDEKGQRSLAQAKNSLAAAPAAGVSGFLPSISSDTSRAG
jgi:hypothetical protein